MATSDATIKLTVLPRCWLRPVIFAYVFAALMLNCDPTVPKWVVRFGFKIEVAGL